jgi:hypothetical protein
MNSSNQEHIKFSEPIEFEYIKCPFLRLTQDLPAFGMMKFSCISKGTTNEITYSEAWKCCEIWKSCPNYKIGIFKPEWTLKEVAAQ